MSTDNVRVAIVGGSGYAGGELLRLLVMHPQVEVTAVTSRSYVGEPVAEIHPNLRKVSDLYFEAENLDALAATNDVICFALPHGKSMARVTAVLDRVRVIDLGGDYRLADAGVFADYYGMAHSAPALLDEAIYGLTEFNRTRLRGARLVACPGCFPTGALLALMPLATAGLLGDQVIVDSKTGSSGSGATASQGTHHPERAQDFRAYKLFRHRHTPEITQELSGAQGHVIDVTFTPHSTPLIRGIFTTAYAFLPQPITREALHALYAEHYADEPFVRLVEQARSVYVAHTNFCDVSLACDGRKVIVNSAIDNLVKGAAGQAVQNLNVMFGLPETMGLTFPGTHP